MRDDTGEERFWAKVEKTADCWLWTAGVTRDGSGQFRTRDGTVQAHRHAWGLAHGMPAPEILRHTCANRHCVRPEHLRGMAKRVGPQSLSRPASVRFSRFVQRTAGCWIWTGSVDRLGYGQFRDFDNGAGRAGRMVRAHRFAWEEARGPLDPSTDVRQACENRRCVRPDHFAIRSPDDPRNPTARQLEVLASWLELGMRRGSMAEVARRLGITHHGARQHLYDLRRRIGVKSNQEALLWIRDHMPPSTDG